MLSECLYSPTMSLNARACVRGLPAFSSPPRCLYLPYSCLPGTLKLCFWKPICLLAWQSSFCKYKSFNQPGPGKVVYAQEGSSKFRIRGSWLGNGSTVREFRRGLSPGLRDDGRPRCAAHENHYLAVELWRVKASKQDTSDPWPRETTHSRHMGSHQDYSQQVRKELFQIPPFPKSKAQPSTATVTCCPVTCWWLCPLQSFLAISSNLPVLNPRFPSNVVVIDQVQSRKRMWIWSKKKAARVEGEGKKKRNEMTLKLNCELAF